VIANAVKLLAGGQLGAVLLVAVIMIGRRLHAARAEERERALIERFRDDVVELVCQADGDAPPPSLTGLCRPDERAAIATLMAEYAGTVKGGSRARLSAFADAHGYVAASAAELSARREWRRGRAARTLGDFGSGGAAPALRRALERERSGDVRAAAGRALGQIGGAEAAAAVLDGWAGGRLAAGVAAQSLLDMGADAVPALLRACGNADAAVRATACRTLGHAGAGGRADVVVELAACAIGDDDPTVREAACDALGLVGGDDAAFALAEALGDAAAGVRRAACDAAARLRIADLQLIAHDLMDDPAADVARAATRAVAAIDPEQAGSSAFGVEAWAELRWGWT
jgi:HEAT repeat protein